MIQNQNSMQCKCNIHFEYDGNTYNAMCSINNKKNVKVNAHEQH